MGKAAIGILRWGHYALTGVFDPCMNGWVNRGSISFSKIFSAWNCHLIDSNIFKSFFMRQLSLWNNIYVVLSYRCKSYFVRFFGPAFIMLDLERAAWIGHSQCTRCYVCTSGRFWGHYTHCAPIFMEGRPSSARKVALLHGSPSIVTWLHNDRVYGMADD